MKHFFIHTYVFFWSIAAMLFPTEAAVVLAQETEADAVLGKWFTEGKKSVVEVYKCGDRYCGKVIWIANPKNKDGTDKLDVNNPETSLRCRKRLGLKVVWDFQYQGNGKWGDGKIYDPMNGKTYSSVIKIEGDQLKVRGYVGTPFFGRTIVCTRKSSDSPKSTVSQNTFR